MKLGDARVLESKRKNLAHKKKRIFFYFAKKILKDVNNLTYNRQTLIWLDLELIKELSKIEKS